jgi:DNA topoisomerase VI subunit B
MKIVEPNPVQGERLTVNLQSLSKKHARQMQKEVAGSVKKLARTFAHLLAKEQRARDKQQRQATKASVQSLVLKLHELLAQPTPATMLAPPALVGGTPAA